MAVVKHISDEIMVMYLGHMIEKAPKRELFASPMHPYTQALLSAIPIPDIDVAKKRILLKGEITSPIDPKPGCRFAPRCNYARPECFENTPELKEMNPGHYVSCHFAGKLKEKEG